MHSKRLGTYGELFVATHLTSLGYSVFIELGDISRIDLILEIGKRLIKIQVKAVSKHNGSYVIKNSKSGPNYSYSYECEDVDVFALFCVQDNKIAWIKSQELLSMGNAMTIRSDETKNGQSKGVRWIDEYTDIGRVLRDYEQNPLTVSLEGDDIVQTTTTNVGQGNLE